MHHLKRKQTLRKIESPAEGHLVVAEPKKFSSSDSQAMIVQATGVSELLSHVQLFVTPWTVAHQAPLSTGFSRQEY